MNGSQLRLSLRCKQRRDSVHYQIAGTTTMRTPASPILSRVVTSLSWVGCFADPGELPPQRILGLTVQGYLGASPIALRR